MNSATIQEHCVSGKRNLTRRNYSQPSQREVKRLRTRGVVALAVACRDAEARRGATAENGFYVSYAPSRGIDALRH